MAVMLVLGAALLVGGQGSVPRSKVVGAAVPGFVRVCDEEPVDRARLQDGEVEVCLPLLAEGGIITFFPTTPELDGVTRNGWVLSSATGLAQAVGAARVYVQGQFLLVRGGSAEAAESRLIVVRFLVGADGRRQKVV